jgi:uncharacterized membrane protein
MKLTFDRSRIVGFSDAVFSIAMTLLILEVVVPSYQVVHKYGMWDVLEDRIPSFIGFVVSFFVSALYWIDYMKITKFVTSFSFKALWANIFLLFFVVLLPFSTAFYVNGINLVGPFVFYSINLSLIALMTLILLLIIAKDEAGKGGMNNTTRNWLALKLVNTILVWALAAVLALVSIQVARFVWVLIFIIDPIIDWYYNKKLQKNS